MGKPVGVYSAKEYHTHYSLTALDKVKESAANQAAQMIESLTSNTI